MDSVSRSIDVMPSCFGMEADELKDEILRILRSMGAEVVSDDGVSAELQMSSAAAASVRRNALIARNIFVIDDGLRVLALSDSVLERSKRFATEMKRGLPPHAA